MSTAAFKPLQAGLGSAGMVIVVAACVASCSESPSGDPATVDSGLVDATEPSIDGATGDVAAPPVESGSDAEDAGADTGTFTSLCGNFPGATVVDLTAGGKVTHANIIGDSGDGKGRYVVVFTAPSASSSSAGRFASESPSVVNWAGSINLSTVACDFDGTSAIENNPGNAVRTIKFSVTTPLSGAKVLEPGRRYAFNVVLDAIPPVVTAGQDTCNWFFSFVWPS